MAYFDATGRRIPLDMPDPAVNYHLKLISQSLSRQERFLERLADSSERIAAALERIALHNSLEEGSHA